MRPRQIDDFIKGVYFFADLPPPFGCRAPCVGVGAGVDDQGRSLLREMRVSPLGRPDLILQVASMRSRIMTPLEALAWAGQDAEDTL